MTDYTPTTEEVLYCSQCWADLKLYPPATELVFERDFTVNTETVRKVYRYVRTDATEFDRWLAEVKAQALEQVLDLIRRQAEGSQLEGDQKAVLLYEGLIAFLLIHNPYRQGETE